MTVAIIGTGKMGSVIARLLASKGIEVARRNALAAMLATTVLASSGAGSASAMAASAKTMWFADSYATAFYTLDRSRHEVVISIEAGPKGGNPMVVRRNLQDGGLERISIDGGNECEKMRVTLVVTRYGDALCAKVLTETGQSHRQQASY